MPTIPTNTGFDGRRFLSEPEWRTYIRRKPVRYIRKRKDRVCEICGQPETTDNPLQSAHLIGFEVGIIYLALTPEFVDGDENIVTAHRRDCNRKVELDLVGSCQRLRDLGSKSLPAFLPSFVHAIWNRE